MRNGTFPTMTITMLPDGKINIQTNIKERLVINGLLTMVMQDLDRFFHEEAQKKIVVPDIDLKGLQP